MNVPTERSVKAQLSTARLLLAQFDEQLAEWRHMSPARRKRTVRGRGLARRMDGLKAGREKWAARVADLEGRAEAERTNGCCGEGEACSAPDCSGTPRRDPEAPEAEDA